MDEVRVRIAPSPTGNLHVGTARSALFNELFARNKQGKFIVRIEDTDKVRSKTEYEQDILAGLTWLRLTWDEGPYRQSERTQLYSQALEKLLEEGRAYQEGQAIKLKVAAGEIMFDDLIRGPVTVHTDSFGGDFVIARSITDPVYHLAVVIDDAAMKISHVIRGEDHVSNTARHILLQQALGYSTPYYAHIPLLLDEHRRKLSKRSGETSLLAYKEMGILPEAMINYLALLGWNPGNDREFFTHEELIKEFSLAKIQKGGAIFSLEKLKAINKHYLRQLTPSQLFTAAKPFLEKKGIDTSDERLLTAALQTEQERVATLAELPQAISFFISLPDYAPDLLIWKKSDVQQTKNRLQKLINYLQSHDVDSVMAWIDSEGLGRGDTLWPMRVALTGREHSPNPFEVAAVLGKQETLTRLKTALAKL